MHWWGASEKFSSRAIREPSAAACVKLIAGKNTVLNSFCSYKHPLSVLFLHASDLCMLKQKEGQYLSGLFIISRAPIFVCNGAPLTLSRYVRSFCRCVEWMIVLSDWRLHAVWQQCFVAVSLSLFWHEVFMPPALYSLLMHHTMCFTFILQLLACKYKNNWPCKGQSSPNR